VRKHLLQSCSAALVAAALLLSACQPRQSAPSTAQGDQRPAAPAAQGQPAQPAGKPGGTLTVALFKDIVVLNPLLRTSSTDQSVRELIFEPLLRLDSRGAVVPGLAESWEISPDGKMYTFKLRRGVKFHNDQEMTAEDAKFAVDWTLNPRNAAYGREELALVERAETADPYTLRMYLKQPSAAFLAMLTSIKPFSVIPQGSLEDGLEKPAAFPPGTGPFKFVQWEPKQRIVLERHPDYWGEKPLVDRIIFRPIEDSSVRITALRAGDVDMVERSPYEWVREIKDGKLRGIGYAEASYAGFRHVVFNVAAPPFDNKTLRHAIAHAIDKQELLHAAYFGFGEPGDQKFPKGHTWYIDGVPSPAYDPDRARALLREAGYNGQEIPFLMEQGPEILATGTTLQAQLKKVGVNIRLDTFEQSAYADRQRRGDFAFMVAGSTNDADPSPTYTRDMRCETDLTRRGQNQAGYCDKDMDALLDRAETELDPARRREAFRQIMLKRNDDLAWFPIGFVPRYFTFRDHVKGFTTDSEGRFVHADGGLTRAWLDK
jgi:ABC-type transport system substrate-binding protein